MSIIQKFITPKSLWGALVWGSMLSFLWVLSGFTVNYFIYLKQANNSIAEVFEWGVIELDDDKFVVCADFRFHTDGVDEYVSQHLFEKSPYPTMELAESALQSMKQEEWRCYWFGNPHDPQVSMDRNFPMKDFVYTMLALLVYVYFLALRSYYFRRMAKARYYRQDLWHAQARWFAAVSHDLYRAATQKRQDQPCQRNSSLHAMRRGRARC